MTYTITINGGAATEMSGLGMTLGSISLVNMQADSASLMWSRRAASEACPLAHHDTVEIFSGERRLFAGRARIGALSAEGAPIQIVGPWSHLEEMTSHMSIWSGSVNSYLGKRVGDTLVQFFPAGSLIEKTDGTTYTVPPGPGLTVTWTVAFAYTYTAAATTGTLNVQLMWSARHWLFRPGGSVGEVYTLLADQWAQIMDGVMWLADPDPFTVGTVELGGVMVPKVRTVSDANFADVVKQCVAMKPDTAVWFEYSGTGLPVLRARVASLETPVVLTVGQRDGQVMTDYKLKVADEIVPSAVVVRWEGGASNVTGLGEALLVDQYPAGVASYAPGVLMHTVEAEMPYVTGLAQEVYTSLAVRRAQGSLPVVDYDFSLGLRPGMVIALDGDAALSGVQLWVQSVSWDANSGIAQLTVGYPQHLQLRDRVDLRGWFRVTFYGPHFSVAQVVPAP